jgi:hypothetical protein
MATILPFPGASSATASELAFFVRIGEAHNKLADLQAGGRLPAGRVVIDASRFKHQRELIAAFRDGGAEIVLDTEIAELAALGRYQGHSRNAPWAPTKKILGPDHFRADAPLDVIGQIARFAVENGVDAVLAPTHYLADPAFADWLQVDHHSCLALRKALDREGGGHIRIDYPLIVKNADLCEPGARGRYMESLSDLPVDNVWVRSSGMGPQAGPLSVRRYISSASALHNLGKPLIADHIGGLLGEALLAFGAVSGIAHGVGERERFDASSWAKLPPERSEDDQFGRAKRVQVPGLYKSLTIKELDLLEAARGGRRLLGCADRQCCPHGLPDMRDDPRRHAAHQGFEALRRLQAVPDLLREHHFMTGVMVDAARTARQVKMLKPSPEKALELGVDGPGLMKRLVEHSARTERFRAALEKFQEQRGAESPRARPIQRVQPTKNVKKTTV